MSGALMKGGAGARDRGARSAGPPLADAHPTGKSRGADAPAKTPAGPAPGMVAGTGPRVRRPLRRSARVSIARSLDDMLRVHAVRAQAFVSEQNCPYVEEFDGNDFAGATHLIAHVGDEPAGSGRIRWFADFAKLERICVVEPFRGEGICRALWKKAHDVAAQKGYRRMLAHVEPELIEMWRTVADARARPERPPVVFSDRAYVEIIYPIRPRGDAITIDSPALHVVRPEGAYDQPGVLDRSVARSLRAGSGSHALR